MGGSLNDWIEEEDGQDSPTPQAHDGAGVDVPEELPGLLEGVGLELGAVP